MCGFLCTSAYVCFCVCKSTGICAYVCVWPDKGIGTLFRDFPSKHLSSHPFILLYLALVVLVVSQTSDVRHSRNTHTQTLRGSLIHAVSLPVCSSNQCWHTALCGTLGQLEDTHRLSHSIILTIFLSS